MRGFGVLGLAYPSARAFVRSDVVGYCPIMFHCNISMCRSSNADIASASARAAAVTAERSNLAMGYPL